VAVWYMGGAGGNQIQSFDWIYSGNNLAPWTIVDAADLNGDGKPDVILQNDTTRQVAVWYMGGAGGNQILSFDWIFSGTNLGGWRPIVVH